VKTIKRKRETKGGGKFRGRTGAFEATAAWRKKKVKMSKGKGYVNARSVALSEQGSEYNLYSLSTNKA